MPHDASILAMQLAVRCEAIFAEAHAQPAAIGAALASLLAEYIVAHLPHDDSADQQKIEALHDELLDDVIKLTRQLLPIHRDMTTAIIKRQSANAN